MWSAVSASVVGTSHQTTGTPCQDANHVVRLRSGGEDVLLAAVADGAGSASHSHIGSSEAVQFLLKLIAQGDLNLSELNSEHTRGWYLAVLEHLKSIAEREAVPVRELACTLLLAIVWREGAIFSQIGDGAWVLEKEGALLAGTWPQTGEYANVTTFLTSDGALDGLQFQRFTGEIQSLAGFTDGIQMLTLNYADKTPGAAFFTKMFGLLRAAADETELIAPLQQFLGSEVITSRTDDDKTLVLAVWRASETDLQSNGTAE
jgi:hypothetical protein